MCAPPYNRNAELTQSFNTLLLLLLFSSIRPADDTRPRVTLVALFPIHDGDACNNIVCVKNYNGFQRMEAFAWAVDTINR
jgi:hypothetical protein